MILIKSDRELELMRRAGRLVAECHAVLARRIRPGVTTGELDAFVEGYLRRRGGIPTYQGYRGYPASICTSVNDVVCHGIPGSLKLTEGDIITVDIGVTLDGYHGDSAWTYAVGEVSEDARRLMEIGEACLMTGIDQARAGNRLGDVGHSIQALAEEHGLGVVR
ncbi:MAG TPA: type I methionyl aminopeptidase, partial [Bacillota bacterium]